jgi:hypothetical protein
MLNSPDYLISQTSQNNFSFDGVYRNFKSYRHQRNDTKFSEDLQKEFGFFKNHMDFLKNQESKIEKIYIKLNILLSEYSVDIKRTFPEKKEREQKRSRTMSSSNGIRKTPSSRRLR